MSSSSSSQNHPKKWWMFQVKVPIDPIITKDLLKQQLRSSGGPDFDQMFKVMSDDGMMQLIVLRLTEKKRITAFNAFRSKMASMGILNLISVGDEGSETLAKEAYIAVEKLWKAKDPVLMDENNHWIAAGVNQVFGIRYHCDDVVVGGIDMMNLDEAQPATGAKRQAKKELQAITRQIEDKAKELKELNETIDTKKSELESTDLAIKNEIVEAKARRDELVDLKKETEALIRQVGRASFEISNRIQAMLSVPSHDLKPEDGMEFVLFEIQNHMLAQMEATMSQIENGAFMDLRVRCENHAKEEVLEKERRKEAIRNSDRTLKWVIAMCDGRLRRYEEHAASLGISAAVLNGVRLSVDRMPGEINGRLFEDPEACDVELLRKETISYRNALGWWIDECVKTRDMLEVERNLSAGAVVDRPQIIQAKRELLTLEKKIERARDDILSAKDTLTGLRDHITKTRRMVVKSSGPFESDEISKLKAIARRAEESLADERKEHSKSSHALKAANELITSIQSELTQVKVDLAVVNAQADHWKAIAAGREAQQHPNGGIDPMMLEEYEVKRHMFESAVRDFKDMLKTYTHTNAQTFLRTLFNNEQLTNSPGAIRVEVFKMIKRCLDVLQEVHNID